jgi:hypothetical protein
MNKYNLNYYETMNNANEYFDILEDNIYMIKSELKDQPDELQNVLYQMQTDYDTLLELEDRLNVFLENNNYQMVCNQIVINEMYRILIKDALPDDDLEYILDYLDSITEYQLIEDVTHIIDKYNK